MYPAIYDKAMNNFLARWHIGQVQPAGFECLKLSIESFQKLYDAEIVVCFNCEEQDLPKIDVQFFDQNHYRHEKRQPMGVTWKFYPPRLDINRKELVIDNDIVFLEKLPQIDYFLENDCTLLAEDIQRCYGKFEKHIMPGYHINSGIYGMPAGFDLGNYVEFYGGKEWQINATGENAASASFDEQGLVALALLNYKNCIIPESVLTRCERELILGKAMHFIGLNRRPYHRPYQEWKSLQKRLYL